MAYGYNVAFFWYTLSLFSMRFSTFYSWKAGVDLPGRKKNKLLLQVGFVFILLSFSRLLHFFYESTTVKPREKPQGVGFFYASLVSDPDPSISTLLTNLTISHFVQSAPLRGPLARASRNRPIATLLTKTPLSSKAPHCEDRWVGRKEIDANDARRWRVGGSEIVDFDAFDEIDDFGFRQMRLIARTAG